MASEPYDCLIVGAGLSGLAAAHFLRKKAPGIRLMVLEAGDRPGGAVQSFAADGYRAEWGPHGFLNSGGETMEILKDTGLLDEVLLAPLGRFLRFLCFRGRLQPLPQNPRQLVTSPLLSVAAKLRLLGDLFIRPLPEDQTIGGWARRRFGRGVDHLVEAAVSGTFAGDHNRLSIDAVMPGLRRLEQEHGSVLRGLKARKKLAGPSPTGLPAMVNFPGGMERLIATLAAGAPIRQRFIATTLERDEAGWTVSDGHDHIRGRRLILALPVNRALPLLRQWGPPVTAIPEARIVNVALGYTDRVQVPKAFGYLTPEREQRFTLGVMFSSAMFPGRCPPGHVLLECLVGGRRHPERCELDDATLISRVTADIAPLLGIDEKPTYARVLRTRHTIPQMEMDHPRLLAWRRELEERTPDLAICGFGWDGIGMNEMTRSAKEAAARLLEASPAGQRDVKGVYF